MGDLEDSIFKVNVPGRYSTWNRGENGVEHCDSEEEKSVDDNAEPVEDEQAMLDMELMEEARSLAQADIPETVRRSILAERERKAHTGVKGVLADYKAAVALAHEQRIADANQRAAILTRIAEGYKEKNVVVSTDVNTAIDTLNSDDEDDDDFNDDAFMREFREKRLKELKSVSTLPTFGQIRDVSSADFISEVEQVDPRVYVVVHLFESTVQTCTRLNTFLEELAVTMPLVKFLRMQASSNEIAVDLVTLPILTIYKGGETVQVHAGIAHEFGNYFTKEDIEWLISNTLHEANGGVKS